MKKKLQQAETALQNLMQQRGQEYYPDYHLAAQAGWINDPNGLIFHQGLYHAFYQHHPYDANWGPMHWGHATSTDMVHWTHQPIALAPGDEADYDGCFSGSAVDDNGILSLIYTGHVWLKDPGDDSAIRQVQCLATSHDGINFEKKGVILTPPPGIIHFRDPKVWKQDGIWWMVVGVRDASDHGQVYLYRGESLEHWTFDRVLAASDGDMGYMWECPDFFPLGQDFILMLSPQGIQTHSGYIYRNRFASGCLRGSWRPGENFKITQPFAELDCGHDFYAPQSFTAADGRRIVMAWMEMWESPMPSKQEQWAGCMTVPREMVINTAGKVGMLPVAELETLRHTPTTIEPVTLDNQTIDIADSATALELILQWDLTGSTAERYGISLGAGMFLYMDSQSQRLTLDRRYPELGLSGYRSVALARHDVLSLHIFIDRSSIEVFVNEGEASLSSRIYPDPQNRKLSLFADTGKAVLINGQSWGLKGK